MAGQVTQKFWAKLILNVECIYSEEWISFDIVVWLEVSTHTFTHTKISFSLIHEEREVGPGGTLSMLLTESSCVCMTIF